MLRYVHTMIRVSDLDKSISFYRERLGMELVSHRKFAEGRYTVAFLCNTGDLEAARARKASTLELVQFWDAKGQGGALVHLGYDVENIYTACQEMMDAGVTVVRPPRDGHWAFVRGFDGIPIELIQMGQPLPPQEPWISMEDDGW
jgi:lactoylglutathione lyase